MDSHTFPPPPAQEPSRTLVVATIATATLAGLLWITTIGHFLLNWGLRMLATEIRLALTAMAVTAVAHTLWTRVTRIRSRAELRAGYIALKQWQAAAERRLDHLDENTAALAGRTAKIQSFLGIPVTVPGEEDDGESTGEMRTQEVVWRPRFGADRRVRRGYFGGTPPTSPPRPRSQPS